jgi:hypothetical protein
VGPCAQRLGALEEQSAGRNGDSSGGGVRMTVHLGLQAAVASGTRPQSAWFFVSTDEQTSCTCNSQECATLALLCDVV